MYSNSCPIFVFVRKTYGTHLPPLARIHPSIRTARACARTTVAILDVLLLVVVANNKNKRGRNDSCLSSCPWPQSRHVRNEKS